MTTAPRMFRMALSTLCLVPLAPINAQTWTPTTAPVTSWVSVASSADGMNLLAAENNAILPPYGGLIFRSTNGGTTWEPIGAPRTNWTCIACSADGTKIVAGGNYTPLFTSTDAGTTWTQSQFVAPWRTVSCSADGTVMLGAGNDFPMNVSALSVSTNSGASWNSANGGPWRSSAASADGSKLVVVGYFVIYESGLWSEVLVSTNSGFTWTQATNAPSLPWTAAALSSEASLLTVFADGGGASSSPDLGLTWESETAPTEAWSSVASSADGSKSTAVASDSSTIGPILSSTNGGDLWVQANAPNTNWVSVASSADGSKLVAAVGVRGPPYSGGQIYTFQTTPTPEINIGAFGDNLLLHWIVASMPFILQQAPDLTSGKWTAVRMVPTLNYSNLQYQVSIPRPQGTTFYRLISQ